MSKMLQPRWVIVALTIVSIVALWALAFSLAAQAKAADVAEKQAVQQRQQQQQLRDAFCGFLVPVLSSPRAAPAVRAEADHSVKILRCLAQ
jgi:type II secretory pathway pseudopilin PulG